MAFIATFAGIVTLAVFAVLIVVPIYYYNRGITLRNRCEESWSNVDTELLRRHDLIPNLVATVQAAAKHERTVFQEVTEARTAARAAPRDAAHRNVPEVQLGRALDRLLAVAEDYPDLKASQNFLRLQHELAITEDRIQAARRFYNANVRDQRDLVLQFPGNLFARLYRFGPETFFEVEPLSRLPPEVRL